MKKLPQGRVSIRLENQVRTKLKRLASADQRKEGSYIRKVLWDHVDAIERAAKQSARASDQMGQPGEMNKAQG